MSYTPTSQDRLSIRYELNDNEAGLYILDDNTIDYYLTKHSGSITMTSLDCAKAMLFKLSTSARDETVDIFSIKGSKAASEFRESLKLYIKDPSLNQIYNRVTPYASGISINDIQSNIDTIDNKVVISPVDTDSSCKYSIDSFSL